MYGASFAFTLVNLAKSQDSLIVVLLPEASSIYSLTKELDFFCSGTKDIPIFTLPDWETLPYDYFSPHQDIISERLKTLYELPHLNKGILLLPIASALQKLPAKQYIQQHCLMLKHEYNIDITTDKGDLKNDYDAVILAVAHKEFKELDLNQFVNGIHVKFDVKSILDKNNIDSRL